MEAEQMTPWITPEVSNELWQVNARRPELVETRSGKHVANCGERADSLERAARMVAEHNAKVQA